MIGHGSAACPCLPCQMRHAPESDAPIGVDEDRGIELFRAPQRPADAVGPEQHASMAIAELHGHPESCCCHAPCEFPACHVPGASPATPPASEVRDA